MHLLGEGAFGCVYYGELHPTANDDCQSSQAVAVKMLKSEWIWLGCQFLLKLIMQYKVYMKSLKF